MSNLPNPLPVVLCGLSTKIGKPVAEAMLPEFEVIHFIQTNDAALAEIPHLLAGRDPQSPHNNGVGSGNYTQPARAVIFGRGFSRSDVETFRAACEGVNQEPVVWVVGDPAKQPPADAPPPGEGYAKIAAQGTKDIIIKWKEDGAIKDEVILY
ncbi:hypothetical protein N7507_000951 [Penicillium longicatenatum]|nr:hypothetical protein N7507_000951 [Penicillium longicatenatum]